MNKLSIKFNKRTVLQYILLYMAAAMTGTLYYNTYPMLIKLLLLLFVGLLVLFRYIKLNKEIIFVILLLTISVLFSRILVGGIGLGALLDFVCPILVVYCAYQIDRSGFCTRFVRFSYFFALFSLLFWGLAMINFSAFESVMSIISIKYVYSERYICYDSFFYSIVANVIERDLRNASIFSEPAQFTILLNSALWILLFFSDQVNIERKKKGKIIAVLLAALVTSQSTTGYICFGFILIFYLFSKEKVMKRKIYKFAIILFAVILLDYAARGSESLVYTSLIGKISSQSGNLDFAASTGKYRLSTIYTCLDLFIEWPLGWGYDYVNNYVNQYSLYSNASAGGGFAVALAVYGVITVGIFMIWIIVRLNRTRPSAMATIAFLFYYFWIINAQSSISYALLLVPLFASVNIVNIIETRKSLQCVQASVRGDIYGSRA